MVFPIDCVAVLASWLRVWWMHVERHHRSTSVTHILRALLPYI